MQSDQVFIHAAESLVTFKSFFQNADLTRPYHKTQCRYDGQTSPSGCLPCIVIPFFVELLLTMFYTSTDEGCFLFIVPDKAGRLSTTGGSV